MKTKSIFLSGILTLGLLAVWARPASAVIIYGITWADLNNNGEREPGAFDPELGLDGVTLTLSRDGGGFSETRTSAALIHTIASYGTFDVAAGGYAFDINWTTAPYNAAPYPLDLSGAYTLTVTLKSGYGTFSDQRVAGADPGFVGAGVSGGSSVAGKFDPTVLDYHESDVSGWDSDVTKLLGEYKFVLTHNVDAVRVDVGMVPVPEPANVALAVFGCVAIGFSVLRKMRAKMTVAAI